MKFIYYNTETIDEDTLQNSITSNPNTVSLFRLKPGLLFVNYRGTSQELYNSFGEFIKGNSILIHDLDSEEKCYYGYMNREVWEWLRDNNKTEK